jgi:hypothetical protein
MQAAVTDFDFLEEIRLRRWAREHYVGADERDEAWHPIVLDEMRIKDQEMDDADECELVVHNDAT